MTDDTPKKDDNSGLPSKEQSPFGPFSFTPSTPTTPASPPSKDSASPAPKDCAPKKRTKAQRAAYYERENAVKRARTAGFETVEDHEEWMRMNEETIEDTMRTRALGLDVGDEILPKEEFRSKGVRAPRPVKLTDEQILALEAEGWSESEYMDIKDGEISEEAIELFRLKLKLPRPPNVTIATWLTPCELTPRHRILINMAATGKTPAAICEATKLSYNKVITLLRSSQIKRRIAAKQSAMFDSDAKLTMKVLVNKAFGAIEEIIDGTGEDIKPATRLDASKFVIDHVIGKPTQSVDIKHSTLAEFMRRLDEIPVAQVSPTNTPEITHNSHAPDVIEAEATPVQKVEPSPVVSDDNLDALINSFSVVEVGKRSDG